MDSSSASKNDAVRVFFEPKSVAIVGASRTPGKIGNTILKNLLTLKYGGQLFPINPHTTEISGLKTYPSVREIPHPVDLAVIAIPASLVLDVVRDCAQRGVRGVVIISSGFGEIGGEGVERQDELLRIATGAGMRILGPNTTGILNTDNRFTTTFVALDRVRAGPVAFIAQTGMFAGMILEYILTWEKFGLSKVAGLGNKCDVADHEILDYLACDADTGVVLLHIEGVKDGRRFFAAVRRLVERKPMIVLKTGRTEAGAKAALSHTGSLTGRDCVFEAMCKQAGVIRTDDFDEMVDFAKMFAYQPVPCGNRVAIVTLSGGAGVMAADACLQSGLRLADFGRHTLRKIAAKMPSWAGVGNPADIESLAETAGSAEAYRIAFQAALSDKNVDLCLFIMGTLGMPRFTPDFLEDIKSVSKPVAVAIIGRRAGYEQFFRIAEEVGIPVFTSVHRAAKGLAALYRRCQLKGSARQYSS